jgi:hypothetical protein
VLLTPAIVVRLPYAAVQNIVMDAPEQWAIWIGPAQQSDSPDLCAAHPCSICWPKLPTATCTAPAGGQYANITLRNITINSPKQSPGVIFGNASAVISNVVFENVVVTNPPATPWDKFYFCQNANGIATGTTSPVPPCFEDRTHRALAAAAAVAELRPVVS